RVRRRSRVRSDRARDRRPARDQRRGGRLRRGLCPHRAGAGRGRGPGPSRRGRGAAGWRARRPGDPRLRPRQLSRRVHPRAGGGADGGPHHHQRHRGHDAGRRRRGRGARGPDQRERGREVGARTGPGRDAAVRGRQRGVLARGRGVRGAPGPGPGAGRARGGRELRGRARAPLRGMPGPARHRLAVGAAARPPGARRRPGRVPAPGRERRGAGLHRHRLRGGGVGSGCARRGRPRATGGGGVNLPIALTLFRIVLVPPIMVFLISSSRVSVLIAAVIFITASVTDWLDGLMARRWNQVTKLGTLLDPVADKLLVAAALVSLVHVDILSAWMASVIIGRELAVTGMRGIALSMGTVVPASSLGKAKTVSQYVALTLLILEKGVSPELAAFHLVSRAALWVALGLTVISGADYFYRFFLHTNPKDLIRGRERWP